MIKDSMGGKSHINPFGEKYKAKNVKVHKEYYAKKVESLKKKKL